MTKQKAEAIRRFGHDWYWDRHRPSWKKFYYRNVVYNNSSGFFYAIDECLAHKIIIHFNEYDNGDYRKKYELVNE